MFLAQRLPDFEFWGRIFRLVLEKKPKTCKCWHWNAELWFVLSMVSVWLICSWNTAGCVVQLPGNGMCSSQEINGIYLTAVLGFPWWKYLFLNGRLWHSANALLYFLHWKMAVKREQSFRNVPAWVSLGTGLGGFGELLPVPALGAPWTWLSPAWSWGGLGLSQALGAV